MNERLVGLSRADVQGKLVRVEPEFNVTESIADELSLTVFDQKEASIAVARRLAMWQSGLTESDKPIGVLFFAGPPGCIHGKTPIYDPIDKTNWTIQKRFHKGESFHVYSVDNNGNVVISEAKPPVKKNKAKMWNFSLANGEAIKVTGEHRFLISFSGTEPVFATAHDLLARLSRGETLFLPSISEHDLSAWHADDQRLIEKSSNSLGDYRLSPHLYDLLPQWVRGIFRAEAPLLVGVLALYFVYFGKDDREYKLKYTRRYLSPFHLSTSYLQNLWSRMIQGVSQFQLLLNSVLQFFGLYPSYLPLVARLDQYHRDQLHEQSYRASNDSKLDTFSDKHLLAFFDYTPEIGRSQITKIDYVGEREYYDFEVPETQNYWASGMFHHNCGKTEMAHAISKYFFNDPRSERLIRLDMSDYQQEHTSQKLTGSPPGYVGYNEEPAMPHRIVNSKNAPTVVLLDEIEKAHPAVLKGLLQAFDKGSINARNGSNGFEELDLTRTLFLMTSNIASQEVVAIEKTGSKRIGFNHQEEDKRDDEIQRVIKEAMKAKFPPEFLDRVDEFVRFRPLESETTRRSILLKFLGEQNDAFRNRWGTEAPYLALTQEAQDVLLSNKDDKGGRGIKREFHQRILSQLPDVMMGMDFHRRPYVADIEDGKTVFYTDVRREQDEELRALPAPKPELRKLEGGKNKPSGDNLDGGEGTSEGSDQGSEVEETEEEITNEPWTEEEERLTHYQENGNPRIRFRIPSSGDIWPTIDLAIVIKEKGRKDKIQLLENLPLVEAQ